MLCFEAEKFLAPHPGANRYDHQRAEVLPFIGEVLHHARFFLVRPIQQTRRRSFGVA